VSPAFNLATSKRLVTWLIVVLVLGCHAFTVLAQDLSPAMLEEASRRTGLSQEEILRRYREQQSQAGQAVADTSQAPGRTSLEGIDDRGTTAPAGRSESSYWAERPDIVLPMSEAMLDTAAVDSLLEMLTTIPDSLRVFGSGFFSLDAALFSPPSFGPVPPDYLVGVGDEIVIDVWGEVELRVTRIVDRDGSIILPRGGKIVCHDRTLESITNAVRDRLDNSYSGLADGSIELSVTLGKLRSIQVFVIGDVQRPGAYELSSVSTVMSALHAAGGPALSGSYRNIRLQRAGETVTHLDLYRYLTGGAREQDRTLRQGDTILIPPRGRTVQLRGEVRRPAIFELAAGETFDDLLIYGGGFTPVAVTRIVHVERIVPPAMRQPDLPDRTWVDIYLEPTTGKLEDPTTGELADGDVVHVNGIVGEVWGWVEIQGNVKAPGRYQFNQGMTVRELVDLSGGAWPDVLLEVAVIDRIDVQEQLSTVTIPLGDILSGVASDVALEERDILQVFALGAMRDQETVSITGDVRQPGPFEFRQGMTLQDLIVRAGGILSSGDVEHVEIQRLMEDKVFSAAAEPPSGNTVETILVNLGSDYLRHGNDIMLMPFDNVVVRRLPWYEKQRVVQVRGEVFYNGTFSLENESERLSSIVQRAGGLKPNAYARGARVERRGLGNVAVDLVAAMDEPGGPQDIILEAGDQILVPQRQYTVKVVGEVGFPTALVFEDGKNINWYVDRAGGYLEQADKGRSRVIHPNGLSQPNKGGHQVLPGSTIMVPVEPPPEGPTTLQTLREISAIFMALATVWLVIDRSTE